MSERWSTVSVPAEVDVVAPDGSEIRLLAATRHASMSHCTLPPGRTTRAVRHRTVDELWYIVGGAGQVWRSGGRQDEVTDVYAGVSISIPVGTSFQFRTVGEHALVLVSATIPPWPGDHEAEHVAGPWQPDPA